MKKIMEFWKKLKYWQKVTLYILVLILIIAEGVIIGFLNEDYSETLWFFIPIILGVLIGLIIRKIKKK